jgi:plasmid stabilization system protein ParE
VVKHYAVQFSPGARKVLLEVRQWWLENRPSAPHAFDQDIADAVARLHHLPLSGTPYADGPRSDVRRLLLRRSRYSLFFSVHEATAVVRIGAIWHMSRGKMPPFPR